MADYHFVYTDVEGVSTQWDDIQRKLGNLAPKPPLFKLPPFIPSEDQDSKPKDKSWIDQKTEDQLEDFEDNPDLDDDRFLQEARVLFDWFRKKRLAEMREVAKVQRYGSVIPISGSDFVREVSQSPEDVWVVVILYKEGLAAKYPGTKFVKIISTDCIPNYPDRNLPTLLVYNSGAVKGNYVGLHSFGRRCTPEDEERRSDLAVSRMCRCSGELVGVALVLCQSNLVLIDGQCGSEQSRKAVLDGVRQRLIEKVVTC